MRETHRYWVAASTVLFAVLVGDVLHAAHYYDTVARLPFFVFAVFGTDVTVKLLTGALFALLIAGCEVSE